MPLTLRNVRPWRGAMVDVFMDRGSIKAVGPDLIRAGDEIDGRGNLLLPGLHDHHLHILATAARRDSIGLEHMLDASAVRAALQRAAAAAPPGRGVRAVDYDERAAGLPDRGLLDSWLPDRPLRVLDRTGALWVLNSRALGLLEGHELPPGAERDARGLPTGHFWREDAWLGRTLPRHPPDLASLGDRLAALGLTGLTDAGAQNGPDVARTLGTARLPQRLVLMGDETLGPGEGYRLGPLKLLLDERDPPDLAELAARIVQARRQGRAVAAHCVTVAELALFLAGLDEAGGARSGDRIEHGGVIPAGFVSAIAERRLTVVTNPAFIHDRGDRYRATVPEAEWGELYRAASLIAAGVPLAGGSDAPYASVDPWLAMRTARDRLTASGEALSPGEAIAAREGLSLYLGDALAPGGPSRKLAVGEAADVILCSGTLEDVLADLTADRVAVTIVAGEVVFSRD